LLCDRLAAEALKDASGKGVIEQVIALGPMPSQLAIKQLGSKCGRFAT
jgi:hypothetical protein